LKEKFGVSWQVAPTALGELLCHPKPETSRRVMKALLRTKKIDL
jgi:predicted 3-demethylubiquinone-9 3-methyltransferase (glyoxalase superfamily)